MATSTESLVLIIFCGGTIGMLKSAGQGYVPEPFYLTETLRVQSRFHDPGEDSLFSHSNTVEGYREWSRSGRTSPSQLSPHPDRSVLFTSQHHLLVRSSRKITVPQSAKCEVRECPGGHFETYLPCLITPKGNGPRIRYTVLEWSPLLDSSNLEPPDWVRIATEVELNYTHFDAFVVLHGTDTMAYTASALSFLLEDLGKTVILTGAQIPLSEWRNDAVDNLLGSLCIAGQYIIPGTALFWKEELLNNTTTLTECCIYFNHTLYRGNRVSKSSILDFDAFKSPNFPPLMSVGIDVTVNWSEVLRQPKPKRFRAHKAMCTNVATLRLFPGITASSVRAFLADPIEGVILEAFGSGNAPNRKDLLEVFQEACDRGVVIVTISQCAKGTVSDAYATGIALLQSGVVPGGDMTPECALTKLGYLLSKREFTTGQVRALMQKPLRGELTMPNPFMDTQASLDETLRGVGDTLSQIVRLSSSRKTRVKTLGVDDMITATAPWSWTKAETLSAEYTLLPILIHLAAARNDIEGLTWCIKSSAYGDVSLQTTDRSLETRAAGIVNYIDITSGRVPLHVAALHGNLEATNILLDAGALVHVRDLLDHTALYYAARLGHDRIVDKIVEAGGLLAGSDIAGGFVDLGVQKSLKQPTNCQLNVWLKSGAKLDTSGKRVDEGGRGEDG